MRALHQCMLNDGRIRCDLCPRHCVMTEGDRGWCGTRQTIHGVCVALNYRRAAGFAVDPMEKKPLFHFLPGSSVLSFGTRGCNLGCAFCQNWTLARSASMTSDPTTLAPDEIACLARDQGCHSVAFTYNEPTVFFEYAVETARACREQGLRTVAVTNGYIAAAAREELYEVVDAANVDLKSFSNAFYERHCDGRLAPVLDTLEYIRKQTRVWLEVTTLLIPGCNDAPEELDAMTRWMADYLGSDTPLHFSAFRPDHKMRHVPPTPMSTLRKARDIAQHNGMKFVYLGNVPESDGACTLCVGCGRKLILRHGFMVLENRVGSQGRCPACQTVCPGVFR